MQITDHNHTYSSPQSFESAAEEVDPVQMEQLRLRPAFGNDVVPGRRPLTVKCCEAGSLETKLERRLELQSVLPDHRRPDLCHSCCAPFITAKELMFGDAGLSVWSPSLKLLDGRSVS